MTLYGNKAGIFVRNSMENLSNGTTDPMLSKIESKIHDIGEFVRQRYGQEAYDNLLNHIYSDKEI